MLSVTCVPFVAMMLSTRACDASRKTQPKCVPSFGACAPTHFITIACKCGINTRCTASSFAHCANASGRLRALVVNLIFKNKKLTDPFDVWLHYTQRNDQIGPIKVYFWVVFVVTLVCLRPTEIGQEAYQMTFSAVYMSIPTSLKNTAEDQAHQWNRFRFAIKYSHKFLSQKV